MRLCLVSLVLLLSLLGFARRHRVIYDTIHSLQAAINGS